MWLEGFRRRPDLARARWYGGALLSFHATGADTGGAFALVEATVPGGEAVPRHTHSREDEAFYVLEGRLRCEIGAAVYHAEAGDLLFLPRGIPHAWRVESDILRMLVLISPAGFEQSFLEFSVPATALTLPPAGAAPDADLIAAMVARERELGVEYTD